MAPRQPVYKRVVVKLSGEALQGSSGHGVDPTASAYVAGEMKELRLLGVQVSIVIGGGNIIRGLQAHAGGMDRITADYMGMLGTVINGLALRDALEKSGLEGRVMSAIEIGVVVEPFNRRGAVRHLEKGRVVVFVGGTGNPYFSTDSAAALRASEIGADAVLKATKVDGVYSADPMKNPDAVLYEGISYDDALRKNLRVMDATAFALCRENRIPIRVFNMTVPGNFRKAVLGEKVGTLVS